MIVRSGASRLDYTVVQYWRKIFNTVSSPRAKHVHFRNQFASSKTPTLGLLFSQRVPADVPF